MGNNGRAPALDHTDPSAEVEWDSQTPTNPDPPNAYSYRVLLASMGRLELGFKSLARAVLVSAAVSLGAIAMVVILWLWVLL